MAQLDILICSLNKGIVRVDEMLNLPDERVRYIVSYQYTDERYLDLIPKELLQRSDVTIYKHRGQGLSANRNLALEKATSELVMFVDDDTHIDKESFDVIFQLFEKNEDLDIAFFQASTYNGVLLKPYPNEEVFIKGMPDNYSISMIEMVCKREKIQGKLRFD
jgi:glycosyltransferase involved in cell wall biosynthesis